MSLNPANYASIENHEIALKYANALQLLAQQTTSKLENCVQVKGGLTGKVVSPADQLGTFSTNTRQARYEETPIKDVTRDRRWYEPTMKHGAYLIDNYDKIKMDLNPEEGIVRSMLAAYHRDIDGTIISAYFGTNKTGKSAGTNTVFDSNNIIGASAASGDVLGKIDLAIAALQKKNVDFEAEEVYFIVPPAVETELKEAGYYVSNDYQDGKVLTGKKLSPYAGVNFVRYNLATTTVSGSSLYRCPFFCKSGVALGKWEDFLVKVSERDDLSYAKQIYMEYAIGATRLEEAKCFAIDFAA